MLGVIGAGLLAVVLTSPSLPSTAATTPSADHVVVLVGPGITDTDLAAARTSAYGVDGSLPGVDAAATSDDAAVLRFAVGAGGSEPAATSPLVRARRAGLATGIVTVGSVADPAGSLGALEVGVAACTAPSATSAVCPSDAREHGGEGSAVEQLIDLRPDVVLGGGADAFDDDATVGIWGDVAIRQQASDRGYTVVDDAAGLRGVSSADQHRPVLGLFAPGPVEVADGRADGSAGCDVATAPADDVPSVAEMTAQASALLEQHDRSYLQVIGPALRPRSGYVDECRRIAATLAFDEAVQEALVAAESGPPTRVIVVLGSAGAASDVVGARVDRLLGI
ncbi:alkaline phosphatase [Mumia flava]|uniref:Alkaline phosphatase n=2 Tax=Mumia flava TaxID=1348852 RepID=A0A2M9ARL3_9ACTN|nr:alkaline phosphatase [Mumia flava]